MMKGHKHVVQKSRWFHICLVAGLSLCKYIVICFQLNTEHFYDLLFT